MSLTKWTVSVTVAVAMALPATAAQPPLPRLRVEPTNGGSVFFVRNTSSQPLTAFLIELVNYPGSSYALWQDDLLTGPLAAGAERRIPITNMTVGAVPDYVKMQAAVYANGTSRGIPEKVAQIIERRRVTLKTTRELIRRLEAGADAAALGRWVDSMRPPAGGKRNSPAGVNQSVARSLVMETVRKPAAEALTGLRATERSLAASKPPLQ